MLHHSSCCTRLCVLDVEFVKTRGQQFARAVAIVPLSASLSPLTPSRSPGSVSGTGGIEVSDSARERRTAFDLANGHLISLRTNVVMELAEALPAGHALLPLLQKYTVQGKDMERICLAHSTAAKEAMERWNQSRKEIRASISVGSARIEKNATASHYLGIHSSSSADAKIDAISLKKLSDLVVGKEEPAPLPRNNATVVSSASMEQNSPSNRPPDAAEQDHRATYRQHQIKCSIPVNFETFDPYSFPNRSKFSRQLFNTIFDDALDSESFNSAVKRFSSILRPYGKGRGRFKSFSFVLEVFPAFLRDVLHASFPSSDAWWDFAGTLQNAAEVEMERVAARYRDFKEAGTSSSDTLVHQAFIPFTECGSLEDLALQLNRTWAKLLYEGTDSSDLSLSVAFRANNAMLNSYSQKPSSPVRRRQDGVKFFSYGSVDNGVLKRTLALCCGPNTARLPVIGESDTDACPNAKNTSSVTEGLVENTDLTLIDSGILEAGHSKPSQNHGKQLLSWCDLSPLTSLPRDQLVSPHQARVIDITSHTLYAAAGFLPPSRRKPSLTDALGMAAKKDETAAELLENPMAHDPVWDAKALGCVCVACGIGAA